MSFLSFYRLLLTTLFLCSFATRACSGLPDAAYQWSLSKNGRTVARGTYIEKFASWLPSFKYTDNNNVFRRDSVVQIRRTVDWIDRWEADSHKESMACKFLRLASFKSLIRYTYRIPSVDFLVELNYLLYTSETKRSGAWHQIWGNQPESYFNHYRLPNDFEIVSLGYTPANRRNVINILPETLVLRLSLGEPEVHQWLLGRIRDLESGSAAIAIREGQHGIPLNNMPSLRPLHRRGIRWQERIIVPGFYEQQTPVEITLVALQNNQPAMQAHSSSYQVPRSYSVEIVSTRDPALNSGPQFYISLVISPWSEASNYLIVSHADIYEGDYHFQFVHQNFPDPESVSGSQQNVYLSGNGQLSDALRAHLNPGSF